MRIESSVTSVSWIPSEVVSGLPKAAFAAGALHYDAPPPDVLGDLGELYAGEKFRFANRLSAWIEVVDGRVVDTGYSGRGYMCRTRFRLGSAAQIFFQPAEFPELKAEPEVTATGARFVQTTGGRTGMPAPRPVKGRPHAQWASPTVWTTLGLTIGVGGSSEHELIGASTFPRHWVYDDRGQLAAKSGVTIASQWFQTAFGVHTPWGQEDTKPLVAIAETALERQLSGSIMHGSAKPEIRRLSKGSWLTEQGQPGRDVFLLLDGMLSVAVDGAVLGEVGPGAVVGERAALTDGRRTASLQALTDCVVAVAAHDQIDQAKLAALAEGHRREEQR
jgi:hypothetical protein